MPTNYGIFKEDEMVHRLNDKKYTDLSNNLKNLVNALFGVVDDQALITCTKTDGYIKPDFCVECNGVKKYVSMKSGRATVVHEEEIKSFVLFLRKIGISGKTQQTILLYQYGDGTLDGSGKSRYNYNEFRLAMEERIEEANRELNRDKHVVKQFIEHCLYLGTQENAIEIDAIYYGDYQYGFIVTVNQLDRFLDTKSFHWMKNLHVGPLQIRPHARYIDKEIKSEKRRHKVDVYWANFPSDMDYISKRYDY